jgi:hypothetical protein
MGRFCIAAYKPKPDQGTALDALIARHWRVLRERDLVTERPRHAMRAADGTVVEVFEWRSAEAVERAHADPAVLALWSEFDAVCEFVPIAALPEAQRPFSEFDALPI